MVIHNYPVGTTNTSNVVAHSNDVRDLKLINNQTLLTCNLDIKVWNLITNIPIKTFTNAHSSNVIMSIEILRENVIVTTGLDKKVKVNIYIF